MTSVWDEVASILAGIQSASREHDANQCMSDRQDGKAAITPETPDAPGTLGPE